MLVGNKGAGKSTLAKQLMLESQKVTKKASPGNHPIFLQKRQIGDKKPLVGVWDTMGQEAKFRMGQLFYKDAHLALLVYDVTDEDSYLNLEMWHKELRQYCPDAPAYVFANKVDQLEGELNEDNLKFVTENNLPLRVISAVDGTNVQESYSECLDAAMAYRERSASGLALSNSESSLPSFNSEVDL